MEGASSFANRTLTVVSATERRTATLGELHVEAQVIAGALHHLGLAAGDVLALQLPSSLEASIAYQAASLLGLVVLPILHTYGAAETSFILRESQARALVIPRRWRSTDYAESLNAFGVLPELRHVVMVDDDVPSGVIPWRRLRDLARPRPADPRVGADDVHLLVYTSGTTASPKGVQHTHNSILHEARSWARIVGSDASADFLQPGPLANMSGILASLLRPYLLGQQTVALVDWNVDIADRAARTHQAVVGSGVPFFLDTLLQHWSHAVVRPALRTWVTGGASVSPDLVAAADAVGVSVVRSYGSTEHPTVTASTPQDPLATRATTDGRQIAGCEVRIVDDAGLDVHPGGTGEILTIGPEQFIGYRDSSLDALCFDDQGWFRTGDLGHVDRTGLLTVTGRKKDIIIRGGTNISAREVEEILDLHPSIATAAVVGAPDDRYGERVVAFVVLHPGAALDLSELRRHFRASGVDRHKTPERLELLAALPRTESGKVSKHELRERLLRQAQSAALFDGGDR
ncbi:MAG TPA: AMP-binding protein [Candidatus Dormibacteraeota bacterium]|nr:AMP-binding protein [Candidatus Dormibacteraeota bacterium]